jgi:hypothetical protein
MTKASPRPPLLAVWLVELFVPEEQTSSVLGDLVEEFSDVAAKSSVANAQRWYWRQTLPTVLHLLGNGFRAAPWFMAGLVVGGIVLVELGNSFTHWSLYKGLNYFNQHVFPLYTVYPRLELFLINGGILVYRLTASLLIGCMVALLSKRREMPATLALSLACSISVVTRFLPFLHRNYETLRHARFLLLAWVLLYFFGGLFALIAGGVVVRRHRLRSLRAARS